MADGRTAVRHPHPPAVRHAHTGRPGPRDPLPRARGQIPPPSPGAEANWPPAPRARPTVWTTAPCWPAWFCAASPWPRGSTSPTDAPGRRALWRRASVTPDEVSSTVLTYGLRPTGDNLAGARLCVNAPTTHGDPPDTPRTARPAPGVALGHPRPRLREPARGGGRGGRGLHVPPWCARPAARRRSSSRCWTRWRRAGCAFAYHGDFDWPGITLANRIMERYEARCRGVCVRRTTSTLRRAPKCTVRRHFRSPVHGSKRPGIGTGPGPGGAWGLPCTRRRRWTSFWKTSHETGHERGHETGKEP